MNKVVCFGEILLRYSPDKDGSWIQYGNMPTYIGGAELNVATALANWHIPVKYITAMPGNFLSQQLHAYLQKKKIDDSAIYHTGNRIGAYYMAQGSDLKHAAVIYDRVHSAFSELKPGIINWDEVLANANWFHFTAITPALNENLVIVCKEALNVAKAKGITISADLNYRSKLWQWGKKPGDVMPELIEYCNVVMGNIWSAEALLNIPVDADIHAKGNKSDYLLHAHKTAHELMKQYKYCKMVAQTFRFDKDSGIHYYGVIDAKESQYVSQELHSDSIVDKAGSGDCFMAGLIHGLQQKHSLQNIVNFAAAVAFGKLHEKGDSTKQTVDDVELIITKFMQ